MLFAEVDLAYCPLGIHSLIAAAGRNVICWADTDVLFGAARKE